MANAFKGKASVAIAWVCPSKLAAQAMREFLRDHLEWMQLKSYQDRPLKLIHYSISESPEYVHDDMAWGKGKYPETTGKTIFHLYEIYDNPEGLHHHWIEGADFFPVLSELLETHQIQEKVMNQMKVMQSLWE